MVSQLSIFDDDPTIYAYLKRKSDDQLDKLKLVADFNNDLHFIVNWNKKWIVIFHTSKTKLHFINRLRDLLPLSSVRKWLVKIYRVNVFYRHELAVLYRIAMSATLLHAS